MANETGNPYGRPEGIPGAGANGWPQQQGQPGASGGWAQQAPQQPVNPWGQQQGQGQQPGQGPGASGGWGQQAPQQPNPWGQQQAPNANGGWAPQQPQQQGQAPGSSGAWGQQAPQQQPPNPWGQQQAAPPYPQQQPPAPQAYAPQPQYQAHGRQPQPPRDGLTANPFALPGQDAYAGYNSAPQGQPVNPYASTPLGVNADAKRDDQTWLERTGLSKGKAAWLGVLLVAAGGFFVYDKFFSTDPDTAKVGDCVHTDVSAYDVKRVACTDPGATAKVLAKFDGTSDKSKCDPYIVDGGSIYRQLGKGAFTLCLGPLDPDPAADGTTPTSAG